LSIVRQQRSLVARLSQSRRAVLAAVRCVRGVLAGCSAIRLVATRALSGRSRRHATRCDEYHPEGRKVCCAERPVVRTLRRASIWSRTRSPSGKRERWSNFQSKSSSRRPERGAAAGWLGCRPRRLFRSFTTASIRPPSPSSLRAPTPPPDSRRAASASDLPNGPPLLKVPPADDGHERARGQDARSRRDRRPVSADTFLPERGR
jgi:hypothetical protein